VIPLYTALYVGVLDFLAKSVQQVGLLDLIVKVKPGALISGSVDIDNALHNEVCVIWVMSACV
jgi:hypothetical protein